MSFSPKRTQGNLPVCDVDVIEWHWRTLHRKRQT